MLRNDNPQNLIIENSYIDTKKPDDTMEILFERARNDGNLYFKNCYFMRAINCFKQSFDATK